MASSELELVGLCPIRKMVSPHFSADCANELDVNDRSRILAAILGSLKDLWRARPIDHPRAYTRGADVSRFTTLRDSRRRNTAVTAESVGSRTGAGTLVSVFVFQSDEHGASDDLHIQRKTPVVNVIQIILKPVRD